MVFRHGNTFLAYVFSCRALVINQDHIYLNPAQDVFNEFTIVVRFNGSANHKKTITRDVWELLYTTNIIYKFYKGIRIGKPFSKLSVVIERSMQSFLLHIVNP